MIATGNRRDKATREADRARVLDYIASHPGTNIKHICADLGLHPEHATGDLQALRAADKLTYVTDECRPIRYWLRSASLWTAIDAYLLRRLPNLDGAITVQVHGGNDRPIKSPEPPARRVAGIQSSMRALAMEI